MANLTTLEQISSGTKLHELSFDEQRNLVGSIVDSQKFPPSNEISIRSVSEFITLPGFMHAIFEIAIEFKAVLTIKQIANGASTDHIIIAKDLKLGLPEATAAAELLIGLYHQPSAEVKGWAQSHYFLGYEVYSGDLKQIAAAIGGNIPITKVPITKWLSYRIIPQSTTGIMNRVLNDLGVLARQLYTDNEIHLIGASNIMCLEHGIPDSALAKGYAHMLATGRGLEKWYQGKRAYDLASKDIIDKYVKVLRLLRENREFDKLAEHATNDSEIAGLFNNNEARDALIEKKKIDEDVKAANIVRAAKGRAQIPFNDMGRLDRLRELIDYEW